MPLLAFLDRALMAVEDALAAACRTTGEATLVDLPEIAQVELVALRGLLPPVVAIASVRHLFDLARETLRVIPSDDGGAVWYELAVPPELRNIVV